MAACSLLGWVALLGALFAGGCLLAARIRGTLPPLPASAPSQHAAAGTPWAALALVAGPVGLLILWDLGAAQLDARGLAWGCLFIGLLMASVLWVHPPDPEP
jgi:hypothetical protein